VIDALWIGLGGALGTLARHLIGLWALQHSSAKLPIATLTVNLAGSFAMGLVMQLGASREVLAPRLRLALSTGLLGGFTTYSSFSFESLRYFQSGEWLAGSAYIAGMVLGCLAACAGGVALARWALG
jgi:CrcB protein